MPHPFPPHISIRHGAGLSKRRQEALNHPKINVALDALEGEIVDIRPLGNE